MANRKGVGFKENPGRKNDNDEQITSYTFKGAILGDAIVALPHVLSKLGLIFHETTWNRPGRNGETQSMGFTHTTTKDGLDIPFGCYDVEGVGMLRPGSMMDEDVVPELRLIVSFHDVKGVTGRDVWQSIVKGMEDYLATAKNTSMFYGRAVRVFQPSDLMVPRYINVDTAIKLYMNPDVAEAIDDHVFFHIREHARLKAAGVRTQRGVLLHGRYGVGKSLIAYKAAQEAIKHKRTFVLCNMSMFNEALVIARYMEPSVLFIEDMDNIGSGRLSNLRNLMSGVESKRGHDVITVLTTNFLQRVIDTDRSLLRPERIDAVVEITPPNSSVIREILLDAGGAVLDPDADWATLAVNLAKKGDVTPAVLLEMLARAKVRSLKLNRPLSYAEFSAVSEGLKLQISLSEPAQPKVVDRAGRFVRDLEAITCGEFTDTDDGRFNNNAIDG